jgi:hypothetical protein
MNANTRVRGRALWGGVLLLPLLGPGLAAQKFRSDDPLPKEPPPLNAEKVMGRKLSDYYDFANNTFRKPGEHPPKGKTIPARGVNTLGEVPNSAWYTNRHFHRPMSIEELVRGPGNQNAPDTSARLTVVKAKTEGVSPGFDIVDSKGRRYNVKFDPLTNPEMATAADVISSKFFYALGYNVPENYIFTFSRDQIEVAPNVSLTDARGKRHPMTERDVTELLLNVPRTSDGRYRAAASFYLKGKNVREFRYYGTRQDDPNDVVPHEHRRDLRRLRVFCAWLGHDDSRAINTLDMLVEENGLHFVRHHLIDFGATLGSDSNRPNSPASGNTYWFDGGSAAREFFSLGLYVPRWARAKYPSLPAVGRFEAEVFDPERWVPFYPSAAFLNCLPDDAYWAAKQVMAFTDEQIRALVKLGQFSDPRAEKWIADCLIIRRVKVGKAFLPKVLPLDRFAVEDNRLAFEDLAAKHKLAAAREYAVQWSRFDNNTEQKTPLPGETSLRLPGQIQAAGDSEYSAADIRGEDPKKTVTVFLRKKGSNVAVVGVDRTW